MNEQMTIDMYLSTIREPQYGERGCQVCEWWDHDTKTKGCSWNDAYYRKDKDFVLNEYPTCGRFMPDSYKIKGMCGNCEHCNNFVFQRKPEYEGKNRSLANNDPVDEPNIYCTHPKGSLNRHTAYKDLEQKKFGVGLYHRQHEWDTCDRWEQGE